MHNKALRLTFLVITLAAHAPALMAQVRGEAVAAEVVAQLTALEERVEAATMAADVAFLDSVYADDFRFKHSTGLLETKEEVLAARRQDAVSMLSRDLDSLDIEIHGDIALSTGRIHVHTTLETTKWREYTIRYVRLYVRRYGRWRLVSHHSTGESFGPLDGRD